MKHYKREYSSGSVKPYERRGKVYWRGTITEYSVTEKTDERGVVQHDANSTVRLEKHRRTLTKQFDIPCSPRRDGSGKFTNQKRAEAAFSEWRDSLLSKAEEDYELAVANEEAIARAEKFSFDSMFVPSFLETYLSECKENGLEPSTLDGYRYNALYSMDFFAGIPVGEVTVDMVRSFNAHLSGRGLSPTTRLRALKTLKAAYDCHRSQLSRSPFDDRNAIKKFWPSPNKPDPNPLDQKSIEKVLSDIEHSPCTSFMCAVELALRSAMRIGEICALKWDAVNLASGDIIVRRAIGRAKGGTVLYEKAPKNTRRNKGCANDESNRYVAGNDKLAALFERRLRYMADELRRQKPTMTEAQARAWILANAYVVGGIDAKYANPTVMGRTWRGYSQGLMGTKGRRPTFHSLRDTWISKAITVAGIDPVTVAKTAGHSDPGFTMRVYADSDAPVMQAAQAKMAEVL